MNKSEREIQDSKLLFADELDATTLGALEYGVPWKILVADDEPEIHKITRIALKGYVFENRGVELLSAYSGQDVMDILDREDDVALILLDVVMEKENTGLDLVRHIREFMGNTTIRIVLRTGQPGKAPEQKVIALYDINDYKAKTELTAQKLFTAVTASLRAYQNLQTIERNRQGLEDIIQSATAIFECRTIAQFSSRVLNHLLKLIGKDTESGSVRTSLYAATSIQSNMQIMAATGDYLQKIDQNVTEVLPQKIISQVNSLMPKGGDLFFGDHYIRVFKTEEGARSLMYLRGCRRLSDMDRDLIRIYSGNVSVGFDNVSLAREIIETQKEVIFTLGEILETRSKETANHVTRVAEVCYILARKFGKAEKRAELLKLAAPMHDIGKIGIPESVLHKPGSLTPQEFDIIKTHSDTGYEILKNSKRQIMQTAAIVAWQHHEKWNGSGYPRGLAGEEIHIYGRIMAIADVFDALSHKRCYKDAWPMEQITALFEQESGRHFDPCLVGLFLSDLDQFVKINDLFPD